MEKYRVERVLGRGQFGEVLFVRRVGDNMPLVIKKTLNADERAVREGQKEAQLLRAMHHPSVIEFYDSFMDGPHLCIVTEFATGQPQDLAELLKDRGGPLAEDDVISICRQLASGLAHAHARGVIHRDIKPANILRMRDGSVKLADFGVGRFLANGTLTIGVGSPAYMAPEHFSGTPYDVGADVWSLGCVLHELITGKMLFSNVQDVLLSPIPSLARRCSPGLARLVESMLNRDAAQRPSAHQVYSFPAFPRLPLVVWHDPAVWNDSNRKVLADIRADPNLSGLELVACENVEDALRVIERAPDISNVFVITNRGKNQGEVGLRFLEQARRAGVKTRALMFCLNAAGLPQRDDLIVDTKDLAVQRYLWFVPLRHT